MVKKLAAIKQPYQLLLLKKAVIVIENTNAMTNSITNPTNTITKTTKDTRVFTYLYY